MQQDLHGLPSIQGKPNPALTSTSQHKGWADKVQSDIISQALDAKAQLQGASFDNADGFDPKQTRNVNFENGGTGDAASNKSSMRTGSRGGQHFPPGHYGRKHQPNQSIDNDNHSMKSIHTESRAYKQMVASHSMI